MQEACSLPGDLARNKGRGLVAASAAALAGESDRERGHDTLHGGRLQEEADACQQQDDHWRCARSPVGPPALDLANLYIKLFYQ